MLENSLGASTGNRTPYLSMATTELNYQPKLCLVATTGIEPVSVRVSGGCLHRLSYVASDWSRRLESNQLLRVPNPVDQPLFPRLDWTFGSDLHRRSQDCSLTHCFSATECGVRRGLEPLSRGHSPTRLLVNLNMMNLVEDRGNAPRIQSPCKRNQLTLEHPPIWYFVEVTLLAIQSCKDRTWLPPEVSGERLLPAARRMSFTRRLLDGNPGRRLHADAPNLCTNTLVCETHTPALSVISHDSRRIALSLSPRDEDSGDRTCLVQSARPLFHCVGGR